MASTPIDGRRPLRSMRGEELDCIAGMIHCATAAGCSTSTLHPRLDLLDLPSFLVLRSQDFP